MVRYANEAPSRDKDAPRINEEITAYQIRLIQADGEMAGVCKVDEALAKARQAGLDLVEISPNADPPVCKILDYGKYKYQVSKKRNEARKKQKTIVVKEIKMRPNIEQHDYDVKTKAAMRFLESGDKVKVTLRFRGREMSHQELGEQVLQRVQADFEDFAKVEHAPSFEGRQMIMVLAPK